MAQRDEVRKVVTVLFADVVSSTALGERLDPEPLRRVMGRYFDEARTAIERHGGTVEKFIGDAVMAVYGIPTLHEDDALRAVRAADDLRASLGTLNEQLERDSGVTLEIRIGLNTGEVVAGPGETLVTGDAVNVAKRLEEAAASGEILAGETTHRLVRDAVEAERVEPLSLKGKGEAVTAFRVLSIREGLPQRARRLDSPMLGRERERRLLEQAYERAVEENSCHLFTVLGPAGVGKSRLVAEFLDELGEGANVVRGRCLSYGEGITFWPLLEVVRQLHGEEVVPGIAARLAGDENAELIAERVAATVGLAESGGSSEDAFWAARKLLETHAGERPLVVVFDDVQWGEPTFLDLVEHVADWSRDAPILVVCMGRPDLLDRRPGWGGGKFNATSVLLEPLSDEDSAKLIDNLLGRAELEPAIRSRVAEAAEGNPLFVEEMLGMLIDDGVLARSNGSWVATGDFSKVSVPPTIQALLAARLDGLAPEERSVAERASVEGKVFHRAAVAELSPAEAREELATHLQALIRKELVRPDRAGLGFPGEDAFRFRHLLIRDAAYEAMPKELRADLHERFARWLEAAVGGRAAEYEEVLGYHLEQAYRYRLELGPADDAARALGAQAAEHLGAAGERALARGDAPAAVSLLDRAVGMLPDDHPRRPKLLCDLGLSLTDLGDQLARASAVLAEARTAADARNERGLAVVAALRSEWVGLLEGRLMLQAQANIEKWTTELEELGDEDALAEAYFLLGVTLIWTGHCADAMEVFDRAASLARAVGHNRIASRSVSWLLLATIWGPMPVSDSLRLCARVVSESGGDPYTEAFANAAQAGLHAMAGRWEESHAHAAAARARLEDLGQKLVLGSSRMIVGTVAILAGRFQDAEQELRPGYEALEAMGEKGYLSTIAAMLALALCGQGRLDEAESIIERSRQLGAEDDLTTQTFWRAAQAEVLASRGDFEEADQLLREARDLLEGTDMLTDIVGVLISAAVVSQAAGDRGRARSAIDEAIRLCESKEVDSALVRLRQLAADL